MSNEILDLVTIENNQVVTTSRIIANGVGIEHESAMRLIEKYTPKFESWGQVRFSVFKSGNSESGRPSKVAILNEQQATLLITLFRNNERVVAFKTKLVDQFYKMRDRLKYGVDKVPQTFLEALKLAVQKEEERLALEAAYQKEKARADDNQEYKDLAIAATDKEIYYPLNVASKCLDIQNMGRNKLFKFLRDEGVLDAENCPYQQYVAVHRFITKFNYDYEFYVTRISPKGMKYVLKKLVANGFTPNMTVEQWEQACRDEIKSLQD